LAGRARVRQRRGTVASTSELAILDLAVALGENHYRLPVMSATNARSIATAVARATGLIKNTGEGLRERVRFGSGR
jgi:hypothetical protein